ncbi:MAG: class I SAM-dependent methyltransferase [Acidimicrobiales bacterium]
MREGAVDAAQDIAHRSVGRGYHLAALQEQLQPDHRGIYQAMAGRRAGWSAAQIANRLPPVAARYEAWWRHRLLGAVAGRPFPLAEELAWLAHATHAGPGRLVIDVACSEGLYGRFLAAKGAEVWLVDHSPAFLRRALRRCREEGLRELVDVVAAPAQALPFVDACADAVVMGGSLNEIGDAPAAVAEMVRVLRPGGRLCLMSLLPATSRRGRLLQQLLRPGGVVLYGRAETIAMLGGSMRLVEETTDGLVFRLVAERRAR